MLNKIDLPASEPEKVKQQIEDVIGIDVSKSAYISAKTGHGKKDVWKNWYKIKSAKYEK